MLRLNTVPGGKSTTTGALREGGGTTAVVSTTVCSGIAAGEADRVSMGTINGTTGAKRLPIGRGASAGGLVGTRGFSKLDGSVEKVDTGLLKVPPTTGFAPMVRV